MASVVIPVLLSFFLGPGVGQLYNKEFKKGAILIGVSMVVLAISGVWYYKALQPYIPNDLTTVDPQAMEQLMRNATGQVALKGSHALLASEGVLMALWLYGVVDAYLVASRRRNITKEV